MDDLIEIRLTKEEQVAIVELIAKEFSGMLYYDAALHSALVKLKESIIHG